MSELLCVIFDVVYNLYVVEYFIGCMKVLLKNGCVLVVIGMLYDKDIVGILVWLKSVVDDWYCVLLEGLCGVMVE